ncbi:MAG: hypothetical protein SGCHY_002413 [Lobulomycetales sp.]
MGLPSLAGIAATLLCAYLVFVPLIPETLEISPDAKRVAVTDRFGAIFGCICLGLTLLSLLVIPYFLEVVEVYYITLFFATLQFIRDFVHGIIQHRNSNEPWKLSKFKTITEILSRLPWNLIPFSFGMFIIVNALADPVFTDWLETIIGTDPFQVAIVSGLVTMLFSNLFNNLPMTILFSNLILQIQNESVRRVAMLGLIVGSNSGANITFLGALAGLMFKGLLINLKRDISYARFFRYCAICAVTATVAMCIIVALESFSFY